MILNKEQVELLDYKQCQKALKDLTQKYSFTTPLKDCPKEEFKILDEIVNTLLWLEDRIEKFENVNYTSMPME